MQRSRWFLSIVFFALSGWAQAQILIGQTVGVSGTVAATVKESMLGASLAIDAVNASGGVGGQRIEVRTLDDAFDTARTLANATTLIEQDQVLALFMTRGTPHTQGLFELLIRSGTPLVGPSTGAMVMHQPVQPMVFNVRAPYQHEAAKAIDHLVLVGQKRIALVSVNDGFGDDALAGALAALQRHQLQPAVAAKFDRTKPDFAPIVPQVLKADAQAVLLIGSGTAVVKGVQQLRAGGSNAQVVTLSNNASGGFVKLLGAHAHGVIVTQVFPASLFYGLVKDANALARARGLDAVSPAMLEGYAAARVLIEGLRRASPKPTRDKLVAALNGLRLDLGGLDLAFSKTDHTGLDFADLSIIGADGRFRR